MDNVPNQHVGWDAVINAHGVADTDDLLFCIDNDTLNDLVLTIPDAATAEPPVEEDKSRNKRPRAAEPPNDLAAFMQRLQQDDAGEGSNPCSSSEGVKEEGVKEEEAADPAGSAKQEKPPPKTKPLGPQAAQKKACREKARRERLNEGYADVVVVTSTM